MAIEMCSLQHRPRVLRVPCGRKRSMTTNRISCPGRSAKEAFNGESIPIKNGRSEGRATAMSLSLYRSPPFAWEDPHACTRG
jgi:hypothetical protein